MTTKNNIFFASVATLALLTGAGLATAQQTPQNPNAGSPAVSGDTGVHGQTGVSGAGRSTEQHAQTGVQTGNAKKNAVDSNSNQASMARQGAESGKPDDHASQANQGNENQTAKSQQEHLGAKATQNAKREAHQRLGSMEKSRQQRFGAQNKSMRKSTSAQNEKARRGSMSAQRNVHNGELKGLQANTSIPMQGSNVNLTAQQRTHIRDSVIDARGAPRVGHVDFDVSVGTVVPHDRVHVARVPETLIRIDPHWRGYEYFIVEDQVVIVDPRDMRIVAVLSV